MRKMIFMVVLISLGLQVLGQQAKTPKFYSDDPIQAVPPPLPAKDIKPRKLNDIYDYFLNDFGKPGERWEKGQPGIPAQNTNTLGEVPDDDWYTNRHYFHPMTLEELRRGPNKVGPPVQDGKWKVVAAKTEGITPGFTILDGQAAATSSNSTRSSTRRLPLHRMSSAQNSFTRSVTTCRRITSLRSDGKIL